MHLILDYSNLVYNLNSIYFEAKLLYTQRCLFEYCGYKHYSTRNIIFKILQLYIRTYMF